MERTLTRFSVFLACALAVSVSVASGARADATQVPIAGVGFVAGLVDPGTQFVSDDGTVHARHQILRVLLFGDLEGEQLVTVNLEQDPSTGTGQVHGVISFSGTHAPSGTVGTFEGSFAGDFGPDPTSPCGSVGHVQTVGQGGEGFEGMKRFMSTVNTCGFITYEGEILDPGGSLQP